MGIALNCFLVAAARRPNAEEKQLQQREEYKSEEAIFKRELEEDILCNEGLPRTPLARYLLHVDLLCHLQDGRQRIPIWLNLYTRKLYPQHYYTKPICTTR